MVREEPVGDFAGIDAELATPELLSSAVDFDQIEVRLGSRSQLSAVKRVHRQGSSGQGAVG